MPLHEYECEACGHRFEVIQKFADPPIETCPKCGSRVKKLQASPAIQFKGSGWYVTDYAKKKSTDDTPKGETTASKPGSSTGDSTKTGDSPKTSEKAADAPAPAEKKPSG